MLEGLAAAFSTYSAIPVPYRRSGGPGTGAALFAFPAVGLVIGAAEIIAFRLLRIFRPGAFYSWTPVTPFIPGKAGRNGLRS